jgi:hypothetical protein
MIESLRGAAWFKTVKIASKRSSSTLLSPLLSAEQT